MTATSKLRNALSSLDDAKRKLKRLTNNEQAANEIRRVIRELDEAESYINRAIRDVKNAPNA